MILAFDIATLYNVNQGQTIKTSPHHGRSVSQIKYLSLLNPAIKYFCPNDAIERHNDIINDVKITYLVITAVLIERPNERCV